MDFNLPEELIQAREMARKFVKQELEPISMEVDATGVIPDQIHKKMQELGLFGITLPVEYGGMELGTLGECVIRAELSKTNACFNTRIGTNNGIGSMGIFFSGTEEQKKKYLPPIASGDKIAAFALSEPDIGSDASGVKTTAVKKGDHWVLNGMKNWITNGSIADIFTVLAVTDKEKRAKGGITAFIVEKGYPGFSTGRVDEKMGQHGSVTSELIFEDCIVPEENVIGEVGQGFQICMWQLNNTRIGCAAGAIGIAGGAVEAAIAYANERTQFGQKIGAYQMIQAQIADMVAEHEAARLLVYRAAWLKDQGLPNQHETSMAKLFASEAAVHATSETMKIFGSYGFSTEYPAQRFLRDAHSLRVVEGTSNIQKIIIAGISLGDKANR